METMTENPITPTRRSPRLSKQANDKNDAFSPSKRQLEMSPEEKPELKRRVSPEKNVELYERDQKETENKNDGEDEEGGRKKGTSEDSINESEAKISSFSESSSLESSSSESSSSESILSENSSSSEDETSEAEKWGTDNGVEENIDHDEEMNTVPYLEMKERQEGSVPENMDYDQKYEQDVTMHNEGIDPESLEIEEDNDESNLRKEEEPDMIVTKQKSLKRAEVLVRDMDEEIWDNDDEVTARKVSFSQGTKSGSVDGSENTTKKDNTPKRTRILSSEDDTSEDSINTTFSNETSKYQTREEEEAPVAPRNIRYEFHFTLPPLEMMEIENTIKDNKNINSSNQERFRQCLNDFFTELRRLDPDTKILKWRDEVEFKDMGEHVPNNLVEIVRYFNGVRAKSLVGRNYLKVRIHTPNSFEVIQLHMQEWANLHRFKFKKCIIQAEEMEKIGNLVYSSKFTEKEAICKALGKTTGFEWGMKETAMSRSDAKMDYSKRVRSMSLFVPKGNGPAAINEASRFFSNGQKQVIRGIKQSFIFVKEERKHVGVDAKDNFTKLVGRQSLHQENLRSMFVPIFEKNIDNRLTTRSGIHMSIRELVLSIEAQQCPYKKEGKPSYLFIAINFTEDASEFYFDGSPGPATAGHIFEYYSHNEEEAQEMIQGLGKYAKKEVGSVFSGQAFKRSHWTANTGWEWKSSLKKFITPEKTILQQNIKEDHNVVILCLEKERNAKESERKAQGSKEIQEAKGKNSGEQLKQAVQKVAINTEEATLNLAEQQRSNQQTQTGKEFSSTNGLTATVGAEGSVVSASTMNTVEMLATKDKTSLHAIIAGDDEDDSLNSAVGSLKKAIPAVTVNDEYSITSSITNITSDTGRRSRSSLSTYDDNSGSSQTTCTQKENTGDEMEVENMATGSSIAAIIQEVDSIASMGIETVKGVIASATTSAQKKKAVAEFTQSQIRKLLRHQKTLNLNVEVEDHSQTQLNQQLEQKMTLDGTTSVATSNATFHNQQNNQNYMKNLMEAGNPETSQTS